MQAAITRPVEEIFSPSHIMDVMESLGLEDAMMEEVAHGLLSLDAVTKPDLLRVLTSAGASVSKKVHILQALDVQPAVRPHFAQ